MLNNLHRFGWVKQLVKIINEEARLSSKLTAYNYELSKLYSEKVELQYNRFIGTPITPQEIAMSLYVRKKKEKVYPDDTDSFE